MRANTALLEEQRKAAARKVAAPLQQTQTRARRSVASVHHVSSALRALIRVATENVPPPAARNARARRRRRRSWLLGNNSRARFSGDRCGPSLVDPQSVYARAFRS